MINNKIMKLETDLVNVINSSGVEIASTKLILEKLTHQTERLLEVVLQKELEAQEEKAKLEDKIDNTETNK